MKKITTKKAAPKKTKLPLRGVKHDIHLLVSAEKEMKEAIRILRGDLQQQIDNMHTRITDLARKTEAPKKEYVLTDADWQRVVAERHLCSFENADRTAKKIDILKEYDKNGSGVNFCTSSGGWYTHCAPLNKPGVMQPYFGQGMPVSGETRVLVKLEDGSYREGPAKDFSWGSRKDNWGSPRTITAFVILP